jgi:hypothetical protein
MAQLAIPLIALGGLYIISNHEKEEDEENQKEGFINEINNIPQSLPVKPIAVNYPKLKNISQTAPRYYASPNQATDKYFNQSVYTKIEQNNPKESVGGSVMSALSLTGEKIDKKNFKHNNMIPFFGGKVKGATVSADIAETQLDNMQGAGSQLIKKTEQAPLFKPHANMTWANGMPNTSEFMLSRQLPSTKMNNIKPWDEEKVAPGLGLGYTTSGSRSGYNAAVEDRNAWLPKTVNQLRYSTNPKVTFGLNGHEGPAISYVKDPATQKTQGRVEKNRPDTDYELGPSRWFTTTGLEKAPTVRSTEVLQHTKRPDYAESDYYGTATKEGQATYLNSHTNNPHKQQLCSPPVAAPTGNATASKSDYGHGSYYNMCNNRTTTKQSVELNGPSGIVKALTAPILDILRPTRKENVIGTIRPNGNVQWSNGSAAPIWNPADRTKTTIREQTEDGNQHLYVTNQSDGGGYQTNMQQAVGQERDTTNRMNYGNAVGAGQAMSQESAYRQRNNNLKTAKNRPNGGNTSVFNSNINMNLKCDDLVKNNRVNMMNQNSGTLSAIPSVQSYGDTLKLPQTYNDCQGCERINPDILTAFKNNPYTQSLNSWA